MPLLTYDKFIDILTFSENVVKFGEVYFGTLVIENTELNHDDHHRHHAIYWCE